MSVDENISITLKTRSERYGVPSQSIFVPSSSQPEDLNKLVKQLLSKKHIPSDIVFDFLIQDEYLTQSLSEHIKENNLLVESLDIEFIPRCPAPELKNETQTNDLLSCVRASKNLLLVGSYDDTIQIWPLDASEPVVVENSKDKVKCVSWIDLNESVGHFVTGGFDQRLTTWSWDRRSNKLKQTASLAGHSKVVFSCSVSPNCRHVASGSWDTFLKIWSLNDQEDANHNGTKEEPSAKCPVKIPVLTLAGHREVISRIHWLPNQLPNSTDDGVKAESGRILTTSWDRSLRVWDVATGQEMSCIQQGPAIHDCDVAGQEGHCVLTASADNRVRHIDLRAQNSYITHQGFQGHRNWLSSIAWSPKFKFSASAAPQFVTGSVDCTIKLWDLRNTSCCLYSVEGFETMVTALDWFTVEQDKERQSGESIAGVSASGELKVFSLSPVVE